MYEDISLRFYRGGPGGLRALHALHVREDLRRDVRAEGARTSSSAMRQRFYERFKDKRHCLIRLTEAQDPFFAALDERMPEYRAIQTPTLIMAGAEDRAIPPWVQQKLCGILPNHRFELRGRQRPLRLHRAAGRVLREPQAVRAGEVARVRGRAGRVTDHAVMNQEERSQRSRAQVLDAALALFSHQGYRATSMREIADKAGVSTGNVYHHFKDKEAIFLSCWTSTGGRSKIRTSRSTRRCGPGAFPRTSRTSARRPARAWRSTGRTSR